MLAVGRAFFCFYIKLGVCYNFYRKAPGFCRGPSVIAETINEIIFQADRLMKLSFLQLPDTGEGYCR